MPYPLLNILTALPAFALVLFRVSGMVVTSPVFASAAIPARVRAAFALALSTMVFPIVFKASAENASLALTLAGVVTEFMIGAAIGITLSLLMLSAEVAGTLIAQQAGLSLSEVINPLQQTEASVIGQVYAAVFTLLFLSAGGHREAVAALLDTYKAVPVFQYEAGEPILLLLVETTLSAFVIGVRVAAPVVIALFLTEAAMGVVSRTVPQLNVLSVGFTVRAFVGLGVAAMTLYASQSVVLEGIWDGLDAIRATFGLEGLTQGA